MAEMPTTVEVDVRLLGLEDVERMQRAAQSLYRALRLKPCACCHHWVDQQYVIKTMCGGCKALRLWEAVERNGWVARAST